MAFELDQDQEEIVALCDRLSAACEGYKNQAVFQATLNMLATSIVNACDSREEVTRAARKTGDALTRALRSYWFAARPH